MAAGGLKSFQGGGVEISMPARADVALWKDKNGTWRGVLHDWDGPVPAALSVITGDWSRVAVPVALKEK